MEFLNIAYAYLKILRIINLLIIAFTQVLVQYFLILPATKGFAVLNHVNFCLFVLTTMIIAGAGYVVNDIYDQKIDIINKKDLCIIPRFISVKNAWYYYFLLVLVGGLISFYIAIETKNLMHWWIFPISNLLLYFYARKYKSSILVGNVLVSLFVSMVWGILFYAQATGSHPAYISSKVNHNISLLSIGIIVTVFAFLVNMSREIIKDIEDIEGDKLFNVKSLATTYGVDIGKNAASVCLYLLTFLMIYFMIWAQFNFETKMYFFIFIFGMNGIILFKIRTAVHKKDFTSISKYLKILMLLGLFGVFIYLRSSNLS